MNKKCKIILVIYCISILSFVWMDATHTIKDGNMNYSPESFSIFNMEPLSWLIPIFGLAMLMLPLYWRVCECKNVWKWSIFPCKDSYISHIIGLIFTLLNLLITIPAIILTIGIGIVTTTVWYTEANFILMLFMYVFFGIIGFIINLCYGLFLPQNYICFYRKKM